MYKSLLMILISHRGNIDGCNKKLENTTNYIDSALNEGFDVEVDLWYVNGNIFLGHDKPESVIDINYLLERASSFWIHCKNVDSLFYLKTNNFDLNYFWHQNDDVTITSKGFFWTYPGKQLTPNSVAVLPEVVKFNNIEIAYAVCSDFIKNYKN